MAGIKRNWARFFVVLAMTIAVVGTVGSAQANPEDQDATAIGNAIESFGDRLASASDALGEYQDLANNLPLADLAPGDPGALNLSDLLDQAVGPLGSFATMSDLATAVDARDGTYGGVTVQFGGAVPVSSTSTSITIPVHATRTVNQPLDFKFGAVDMTGGSLGINFELNTTLTFNVDSAAITSAATAPPTALSLVPPTVNLCAHATASVAKFTARFGFTDVNVSTDNPATAATTEAATLHACASVAFNDPDSVGGITMDEWTSHALTELAPTPPSGSFIVKGNPSGNDLDTTFYVDATLVDGDAFTAGTAADASIAFTDTTLADGFNATPAPTLGALGAWQNITAGDVANGLAEFVSSLSDAQNAGNGPLPLLKKSISDTFDGVKPLLDYTERLTNATVGCGTEPGDADHFPTGVTDNLTTDTLVYCRAQTQQKKQNGSVVWSVPSGVTNVSATCVPDCVNTSGAGADATLGADGESPTADAVFKMIAPGNFTIELSWDADPGAPTVTRKAIPRPGSAQELFQRLAAAAGLDNALANLGYSSATKSLTFRLKKDNFDPAGIGVNANIGDLIRNATNIAGLKDVLEGVPGSTSFTADASDIDFDVTFGVLLLQDTSDITPLRGTATAGSTGNELEDTTADFTDGTNDPHLGQVLKKTSAPTGQCTIAAVAQHKLTCAAGSGITWAGGDTYDVDGGLIDRFYVKVDNAADKPELSVGALNVTGTLDLDGKVGFVEVQAGGNGSKNTFAPGTAFGISKADATKPVLRVDIKTPAPFVAGGNTITDAIGVGELLFNLDSAHLSAVCNLKATAGIGINASVNGQQLASGGVALNWPNVFKSNSCEPDFSTIAVAADSDFNFNLRDFDPFPSVTGTHTAATSTNLFDASKNFKNVGFNPAGPASAEHGANLLNLKLTNKTTGASCTIATINDNELECTLSGGTRPSDDANKNKWKTGDEYAVEGNALGWLGYILDNLDKLVDQVDQIDPGLTDKEIPLIGISTKDLVGKIKSIKQTIDELRGAPLAEIDCTGNPDGTNPAKDILGRPFNIELLPDNTTLWCRAVSTVDPTAVTWSGLEGSVTVTPGAFVPDPAHLPPTEAVDQTTFPEKGHGFPPLAGDVLGTVGPDENGVTGDDRVQVVVSDGNAAFSDDTAIDEWQIKSEFTDAAGNHTVEFPSSLPPQSLQQLADLINEKLGVDNVIKLDLLDLPAAGAGPKTSGQASAGSTEHVLEDSGADFPALPEAQRPDVGNLLINKTDKTHCTITAVATETLACALGSAMQWDNNDDYEVVGNGTKDLVVSLGVGFCSGGGLCETTDRSVPAVQAPLNVAGSFADLIAVDTQGKIELDYDASAQLDVGIPLKLDLTPDVVVLDTTGVSLEAKLDASDIGFSASLGPVSVKLGTAITDTDPVTDGDQPGIGIGKIGAKLSVTQTGDDGIPDNNTKTFGDFLSGITGSFTGTSQDCDEPAGSPVEASGDACALVNIEAVGVNFADPVKVECTIGGTPLCNVTLPPTLQSLINGEPLDWKLLLQVLPQILANLQKTLDGAAQDIHIPLIGDTLDAGADVIGAFNNNVVLPFSTLAQQILNAADQDGDGDVDAYDLSKVTQQFIFDKLKDDGGGTGADLLEDTNGVDPTGAATLDDIVVTPLCGSSATVCANGQGVTSNLIRDFRVTFKIGQGINGEVPFDIGLRGLPLRLTGGVHGSGSWSLLVDFGLSFKDGPYIVANGKKSLLGKVEKRDFDVDSDSDGTNDAYSVLKYLQDDDTDFNGANNSDAADDLVELGMWLQNTTTPDGCRVTKIEEHKLYCDDFGTAAVEGVDWHGTDGYEVRARHAPDTADPAVDGSAPELSLNASVTMGNLPGTAGFTCTDSNHDYTSPGSPAYLNGFSNTRCLAGELAFLQVTIRDADAVLNCGTLTAAGDNPTALCLDASLDFKKSGGNRVSLSDLIGGKFSVDPSLAGKANVDTRFRTGLNTGQNAGFPSVLGKFHLFWGFTASPSAGLDFAALDISFDGVNLDAGKFISAFLSPIVKQVKNVTGPLMPVVEMIQGEVPIISDLSKLIGQGPVTVLDLLEAISGNDLSLLRSILQFVKFVNTIPTDGNLLIPLGTGPTGGSFSVTGQRAGESQPLPEEAGEGLTPGGDTATNLIDEVGKTGSPYSSAKAAPDECVGRGSTFGVCGLTFPFLGNAGEIFGVLMGKDTTLVHYDAGTFGAGAGFGFCFPPILIGPVPVQICIGGSFRVEGRFAMGYDTSGLRKVLEGGTGTHLLDGIFFDDYNAQGVDVPEIAFTGRVYAEGAVSVYIFKVGIRGEIIFTMGLDLHEDPPLDGKLRIEEIVSKLFTPICLFDVTGKIEAALSAFVKIDLFITSVEFSIQIVKITLLEFKLDICTPKPPVLAVVTPSGSVEQLILHMGNATQRNARNIATGEINEKFTVRQMESYGPESAEHNGKTRFSVSAFGIQQDYFLTTSKVGTSNAVLIANADNGDDVISLLPGGNSGTKSDAGKQNPPVPFTLRANISAGTGNDEITTGESGDTVDGDPGDDKITSAGGNDTVRGGTENDNIDAGDGDDTNVHGNGGNDIVNGGKGADKLFGDADDDVLTAGPDDPAATSVDELHGGPGNDTLSADGGNDKLWGDEDLDFNCSSDGSTSGGNGGKDTLIASDGDDQLHGGNGDDSLDGGNGNDQMCGGGGADEMVGGANKDTEFGGGGDDDIAGGTDNSPTASGGDELHGGPGRDYMIGDEGTLSRNASSVAVALAGTFVGNDTIDGGPGDDFQWGQGGVDTMKGGPNDDEMRGGSANDVMNGNDDDDEMYGEDGADAMHGDDNNDLMRGGPGTDTMDGDDSVDEMYGDGEVDVMRGGNGDDLMRGGGGDDKMEGNANDTSALPLDDAANPLANVNFDLHLVPSGVNGWAQAGGDDGDVMYGDAGQDDMVGGSQGGSPPADSGDTMLGNTEQDVIAGDNAVITRPGGNDADGTTTRAVSLSDPTAGGADYIQGNLENDDVYAGGDGDLVHGNEGADYIEGNGASDGAGVLGGLPVARIGLYGDTGQDDIIGGTSQGNGGVADGADDIWGGQDADVAVGDNAAITRAAGSDCPAELNASAGYDCNTFRAGDAENVVIRRTKLFDVATTTTAAPAGTSGGDTIGGQDGHDRLYGQGGGDWITGGTNDDFAFGNDGADTIKGGDGQDDLIGGTGRTDSSLAATATDGRLDAGDVIFGEADFDAIAGDNSRMVRKTDGVDDDHGAWVANTFNSAVDRLIALMDVATTTDDAPLTNGTSGNDQLLGGAADDVIYGQGGNDGISGGAAQDIVEGNANGTGDAPDPDGTYGGAWPAFAGDVIHGDDGADDIAGGTGWIYRMVAGVETGDPIVSSVRIGTDGRKDAADTIYGDDGGDAIAGDNTVIERALSGGAWIIDDLHSPDALQVVRRITRERDVAIVGSLAPLTNGTSGDDVVYGNNGVDVAYGQGGDDQIQGNAHDDHLEGNAGDDTIQGNEGRDDIIGGTGRTFSNDESTAATDRIDNPVGDDAANDVLHGGDGAGAVAAADDDTVIGDNGTVDRVRGLLPAPGDAELARLPFNGAWGETTWNEPNILRVIRLLDVSVTGAAAPETNGTNGNDTINGEANDDVLFGEGGNDTITGDDADLGAASAADASPGGDYIEGNGAADAIRGDGGEDDITGGGSATNGVLDADRDGTLDPTRTGETLRDAGDTINGDSGDGAVGLGDVVAGDNARIQRKLDGSGDWRADAQRGTKLRDIFLFDIRIVGNAEPGNADAGESGADTISGNGGNDILLGQDNGQTDDAAGDEYGREAGAGAPNCQNATGGPGTGTLAGSEESPNGDDDDDDLPDINDPQCRVPTPGDTVSGQTGQDYIEGNSGSDNLYGNEGEDDVLGGSSSNNGHLNAVLLPADRDAGFTPTTLAEASKPNNLNDGHDVIEGNGEDDTLVGDNAFVDRYLSPVGAWITVAGPGGGPYGQTANPNPEPARGTWTASNVVRRDVTTRQLKEVPLAFGNDFVKGGEGKDDLYGLLGNDWLEGNEEEDAIVGDMGKIVDNQLNGPTPDELADPSPLNQFLAPQQPFLGSTVNYTGMLKREVTLYAFDQSVNTAGIGHDVALGGAGNDWIHTGPGEDLANGNTGDDRIFLGDNFTAITANQNRLAHDRVDAGWGGSGHDHVFGGYGADYLDVRPRTTTSVPGLFPASDPETWFQVAGAEASQDTVVYGQENFEGIDYLYGGWDQDTLQANEGDNGPAIGDRLLDWSGSFNGYYLCPSTYGDWVSTRAIAPGLIAFLQGVAQGDGATTTATAGTSGFRETAIVFAQEAKFNTKPIHADTPAHFTCGPGTTVP